MSNFFEALALIVVSILIGYACNKPSSIGADLLPDEDIIGLSFTDSISLLSSSLQGDSVKTYGPSASEQLSFYLCGELDDPVFGTSSSEMYMQFGLNIIPILEDPVIDEIVLSLAYANTGHTGRMDLPQSFEVFRLRDTLSVLDTLYSNDEFQTDAVSLGDYTIFNPATTIEDSVLVDGSYLAPQLRITLDSSLGQELLDSIASPDFLGLTDEFTRFFNGLNIRPGSNNANTAMMRFYTGSIYSELTIFYRDSSGVAERESVAFPIRSSSVKSVRFQHDHSSGTIADFLDGNAPNPEELTFIQSMEGIRTKIEFTNLEDWENVIVNKAELILTAADAEGSEIYPLPTRLIAFRQDDDGQLFTIPDVSVALSTGNFSSYRGDQFVVFVDGNKVIQYRIYITAYLQGLIDGRYSENAIYLIPSDRGESASRVVLGGSINDKYPMTLNLTYTQL